MDDKITSTNSDTEYKFSDAAATELLDASVAEQNSGMDLGAVDSAAVKSKFPFKFDLKNINWQRAVVPGAIVLTILIIYGAFSFYSSNKASSLERKKIAAQEAALAQQRQFAAASIAASKPISIFPEVKDNSDQTTQMQRVMQQKIDNLLQQVKSNQDNFSSINNSVAKTQQDVAVVSKQIDQLTAVMQQMVEDVDKLKAFVKKKPKAKVAKLPVAYHIRAIVPGRAWLDSADGKSVTLKVGDKLEGYGTVNVIDPDQGMVIMSNGSIIQYGVNDF